MPTPAFVTPRTLDEAVGAMRATAACHAIAGGTDVMVMLQARTIAPAALVNLWSLPELKGIREADGTLEIGAAESYTAIIRSRLVQQHAPALIASALTIGAVQIQNRGTLGGNLANASPAGDTLPIMLAHDAVVVTDRRTIAMDDFFVGYRQTALAADELIVSIRFPIENRNVMFRKVGTRRAQAISKVVLSVCREPVRIAIGSVAEVPLRAVNAERALERGHIADVINAIDEDIRPIDDVRSTATYRRTVTKNVLKRMLQ